MTVRGASKNKSTPKNPTLLQKLTGLSADAEDDENILSDLTPQKYSKNINEIRDHITTNSTIIPVLIYQTGYTSPTIVHSLENSVQKRTGMIRTIWVKF